MTNDQKAVILDYAQELQTNDEPWREFEFRNTWMGSPIFHSCSEYVNPIASNKVSHLIFRRRPKTITVTMPVPVFIHPDSIYTFTVKCKTEADRDAALAAIKEQMEVVK